MLRKKLGRLNAEAEAVQTKIDELLNDPEINASETEQERKATEVIEGFPVWGLSRYRHSYFPAEERLFYKAGFRTFQDVLDWMDNPVEKKQGIGAKRIDNFRRDMRRYLRWDDELSYQQGLKEGKYPILQGMAVHFKDPSKTYPEYNHGVFAKITTDYSASPEWIEVCEVIIDYSSRAPYDRKDGATYCIPFAWVTEFALYNAIDTVLPLDNYDEHDWLHRAE